MGGKVVMGDVGGVCANLLLGIVFFFKNLDFST
jgi:hypothetical protein